MQNSQSPDLRPNFIDRVIEYVDPNRALVRSYSRSLLSESLNYEGASRNARLGNWAARTTDANTAIRNSIGLLRDRSRDLIRNDPFANAAKRKTISNMVGEGIIADIKGNDKIKELWESWANTTDIDVTDDSDFSGLQQLMAGSVFESGSILVRFRLRRATSRGQFPLQIQLIEPDHLDTSKDSMGAIASKGNYITGGIEYNSLGKPVFYHLLRSHPGDGTRFYGVTDSVRVPASDIVHLFRLDRPGQGDGVPWTAPALVRMHDFHEYENAQLVRQKMAACFMAFMQVPSTADAAKRYKERNAKTGGLAEKIEPATIEMLPPGYDVTFANPPQVGKDYESYSKIMLRGIAAGTGLPYEVLTGDLSNVNFSSARLGWMEFEKEIKNWRKRIFLSKLLPRVWNAFLDYAELLGYNTAGVKVKWIAPRRALIDPEKEIRALVAEIRGGLVSHSEAIMSLGRDPDDVYDQTEADNEERDKRKLVNDADPRLVTGAGIGQSDSSTVATDSTEKEN